MNTQLPDARTVKPITLGKFRKSNPEKIAYRTNSRIVGWMGITRNAYLYRLSIPLQGAFYVESSRYENTVIFGVDKEFQIDYRSESVGIDEALERQGYRVIVVSDIENPEQIVFPQSTLIAQSTQQVI